MSNDTNSSNVNTKLIIKLIIVIVFLILALYFHNFYCLLSKNQEIWGQFGDYIGGILNPIIAGFAFYYIAKTYELQKTETKKQIEIATLTALINSKLTQS